VAWHDDTHIVRPRAAVTSTQAVLWRLLCLAGIATPITGFGRAVARALKRERSCMD
jgi:hypothetical protein